MSGQAGALVELAIILAGVLVALMVRQHLLTRRRWAADDAEPSIADMFRDAELRFGGMRVVSSQHVPDGITGYALGRAALEWPPAPITMDTVRDDLELAQRLMRSYKWGASYMVVRPETAVTIVNVT